MMRKQPFSNNLQHSAAFGGGHKQPKIAGADSQVRLADVLVRAADHPTQQLDRFCPELDADLNVRIRRAPSCLTRGISRSV